MTTNLAIPDVTLVTTGAASSDTLTDQDYRDIYEELRSKSSLDKFIAVIGSTVSKAWWSKYDRHESKLSHDRRNELRTAVGLSRLPEPVSVVTAAIRPNATVWQVGAGRPDRVVMFGEQAREPLTLRLNGSLQILPGAQGDNGDVTQVTPPQRGATAQKHKHSRRACFRPCLAQNPAERIPQLRRLLAEAEAAVAR